MASNDTVQDDTSSCECYCACVADPSSANSFGTLFVKRTALGSYVDMISEAISISSRTALKCVVNLCSTVDVMPLQLAISNAPSPRRVHRSTHLSFPPGCGSQQGRMKAMSVNAECRPRLAMNVISKYPTPGSKMRPPTTWSAKSASAEGESIPVEVSSK